MWTMNKSRMAYLFADIIAGKAAIVYTNIKAMYRVMFNVSRSTKGPTSRYTKSKPSPAFFFLPLGVVRTILSIEVISMATAASGNLDQRYLQVRIAVWCRGVGYFNHVVPAEDFSVCSFAVRNAKGVRLTDRVLALRIAYSTRALLKDGLLKARVRAEHSYVALRCYDFPKRYCS